MKKAFFTFSVSALCLAVLIALGLAGCANTGSTSRPEIAEPASDAPEPSAPEWGSHLIPEMVWVEGGSFMMGSNDRMDLDAAPPHRVTLDGFYVSKYEITQLQYWALTGFNPSFHQGGLINTRTTPSGSRYLRGNLPPGVENFNNLPVEQVNWFEAVEFCNKLSGKEGLTPVYTISNRDPIEGYSIKSLDVTVDWKANGYRLPTEAEWEYAARGGNSMGPYFIYSGSNDPYEVSFEASYHVHNVGQKKPNSLGIYDMSGNVWEWCWDLFDAFSAEAQVNPKGADSGSNRVRRGGGPNRDEDMSLLIKRNAYRDYQAPINLMMGHGIRVVRNGDK